MTKFSLKNKQKKSYQQTYQHINNRKKESNQRKKDIYYINNNTRGILKGEIHNLWITFLKKERKYE